MSSGEEMIARLLTQAKIKFVQEKTFKDLRGGKFRYDFYCPNLNGKEVIFEFNGRQHYEQVTKFQPTLKDFHKTQEHDRRKISYALANNILIYCIPFWEEEHIKTIADLCNIKFLAISRWHNDLVWGAYKKGVKK